MPMEPSERVQSSRNTHPFVDKLDLETRIDACSEALLYEELTPKQMKTIIKQNTICEQLQEQVKKLTINKESLK